MGFSVVKSALRSLIRVELNVPQDSMGDFGHLSATTLNPEHFPCLQRVELCIRNSDYPEHCNEAGLSDIFPGLHPSILIVKP